MAIIKRLIQILLTLTGLFGCAGCLIAIAAVWFAGFRVQQGVDALAETADRSVAALQAKLERMASRFQDINQTSTGMRQKIETLPGQITAAEIRSRVDLAGPAQELERGLLQVDEWFEVSETSLTFIKQMLSSQRSLGMRTESPELDELLLKIGELRQQLDRVMEMVKRVRPADETTDEPLGIEKEKQQLLSLILRIAAAMDSIESRIKGIQDRLKQLQVAIDGARVEAKSWVSFAAICSSGVLFWMALGQAALSYQSVLALRRRNVQSN